MRPFRFRTFAPLCAAALAGAFAASCRRDEDQAAKARLFAPEQPHGSVAAAADKLDARALGESAAASDRVLRMPRAEVSARLGSYKAEARVQFAWFRGPGLPDGGAEVQLSEESTLTQAAGGDFTARLANDHNEGFELVWVGGEAFERGLFGPYHKRRTDRTDPERLREQALAALPTFDRLARGLKLALDGEVRVEGRRAYKYKVTGWGARTGRDDDRNLPPVQYPEPAIAPAGKEGGPDPDTARRLDLFEREEPVAVSGSVVVDADTAAPLACELKGHFRVPGPQPADATAELNLHAVLTTTELAKDLKVKAPAFEPEASVPHAVKDPLRFLGKAAQPGAPSTEDATEDDDTDQEPPAPR
ncbi:MAG TPA: hypothetical protein VN874_07155 [Myxococcales bacterium]|jgi:hypothetical protein|nr:hypothetical protein [Myxococcales bacterium]